MTKQSGSISAYIKKAEITGRDLRYVYTRNASEAHAARSVLQQHTAVTFATRLPHTRDKDVCDDKGVGQLMQV